MRRLLLAGILLAGCTADPAPDDDGTPAPVEAEHAMPEFCRSPSVDVSGDGPWVVITDHYRLEIGASYTREAAEGFGRLAETAYFAFEDWFGTPAEASDGAPLDAIVTDTQQQFEDALRADGLEPPAGAGGYYHGATERAYLYRGTEYYTRVLFLHELTHQYHRLSVASRADAFWFVEGLAEFLSRHDWDGECLRLGIVPLATFEDLPAEALEKWEQGTTLADVVVDLESVGRPLSMAVVRWLALERPELWAELSGALDAGVEDEGAEAAAIWGNPSDDDEAFGAWLQAAQNPLVAVYSEWWHQGPTEILGWADGVLTIAALKDVATGWEQTITLQTERGDVGALLEFDDRDHYTAMLVSPDGSVNTFEVDEDGAFWWAAGNIASPGPTIAWTHRFEGDEAVVTIDGSEFRHPLTFTPAGGPAINDGEAVFSEISWSTP